MARYQVRVLEIVDYRVPVEAADEGEAMAEATELLIDADDPNKYFFAVIDRTVDDISELPKLLPPRAESA